MFSNNLSLFKSLGQGILRELLVLGYVRQHTQCQVNLWYNNALCHHLQLCFLFLLGLYLYHASSVLHRGNIGSITIEYSLGMLPILSNESGKVFSKVSIFVTRI